MDYIWRTTAAEEATILSLRAALEEQYQRKLESEVDGVRRTAAEQRLQQKDWMSV